MLSSPYHVREQVTYLPKFEPTKEVIKLNESQPITYFFHAVLHYGNSVKQFKKKPALKENRDRYKKAQKVLLNSLFAVYSEMHDSKKSNRDYLRVLGPKTRDDVQETFYHITFEYCFGIFYGILADDQYIGLRESASNLHQSFVKTSNFLIARCKINILYPYDDLFPVLEEFDRLWADFESRLIILLIKPPNLGMIQFVSNEVFSKAYWNKSISRDTIENNLVKVVLAMPRLIVMAGLTDYSEIFDISDPEYELNWFQEHSSRLKEIKQHLEVMNETQKAALKICLIHSKNDMNCEQVKWCYFAIKKVADTVALKKKKPIADILDISLSLRL